MSKILQALKDIVGKTGFLNSEDVAARPARWGTDIMHEGMALLRPATSQEMSEILALCNKNKQSIITVGGNTGLAGGVVSNSDDILISLERMNKVIEIDKLSRTITVEAGVTLQEVQELAADAGLLFPVDLGARGSATIGGNIATNAGGNSVIRYGMMRDLVLGVEVVLADGTIISSLNKLLKNNTGYDTKQLFIGSEGTLGVITKAVLKLKPKMTSRTTAFVAVDSFPAVLALLHKTDSRLGGMLSSFEVMWKNFYDFMRTDDQMRPPVFDNSHPYYILIESAGGDQTQDEDRFQAVIWEMFEERLVSDAVIAQSEQERSSMWAFRDNISHIFSLNNLLSYDISVPQSHMENYVSKITAEIEEKFDDHNLIIFGHVGDSNLHIIVSAIDSNSMNEIIYEPLLDIGGSVSAEHGIGIDKKPYLANSRSPNELALMLSLKKVMDPNNILNPGKVIGQR